MSRRRLGLALVVGVAVGLSAAVFAPAAVTVTAASGGTNISADRAQNSTSGAAFTTLGNIVVTENLSGDFADTGGASRTLILTAPSNWRFNAGVGTVSHQSGRNISASSITVAASTITVNVTVSGTNKTDVLTISGIQVQSTNGALIPNSGNILRTAANPGTATITGITNGSTNFGSLSQVVGATSKLAVTSVNGGSNPTAGTGFSVVVRSQDQFSNFANVVAATGISLSLNTGTGTLGGTLTGTIGAGSSTLTINGVTYTRAESGVILTATRTSGDTLTAGNSGPFTVNPGALDHFLVEAQGGGAIGTQAAGTSFNIRVTAQDAYNNTVTGFTGTVDITSTGTLSLGSGTTAAFSAGVLASHTVRISNTGSFTITATRTSGGAQTGTSNSFTVNPGALDHFLVEAAGGGAIGTQTAGTSFAIKVTAQDANNNTVTGFTGTVDITSTGTLSLGSGTTAAFSAGVLASHTVRISNSGSFTITATRTSGGTQSGTSNSFNVNAGALDHFAVEAQGGGSIGAQTAGTSFNIRVTAQDADNNTVTGYTGTVDVTSTGTLSLGSGTTAAFSAGVLVSHTVRISNSGSFTVTATRTSGGPQTGTSNSFTVNPGAATKLAITAVPATVAVGASFSVTVQSQDASGNASNVVAVTGVSLSGSGSGALSGNTGTIAAGTSSTTLTGVSYDTAETITLTAQRTSGDVLSTSSASSSIVFKARPTSTVTFPASGSYNAAGWDAGCAGAGFCGTATDNSGTGLAAVELSIQRGSGNYWNGSGFSSGSEIFVAASLAGSNWSYGFGSTSFPADDSYTVHVRARDNLGGVQSPPTSDTFTYDSTAPIGLTITAPSEPTNDSTPTFSGAAGTAAGDAATVTVKVYDSGSTLIQTRTAPVAAGSWLIDANPALADGSYTATATQADAAGNSRTTGAISFSVDTAAPTPPSGLGLSPASPVNENNPKVTGTAEAGSTVSIYASGDCSGGVVATGGAAGFASPGISVPAVADNSSTVYSAKTTDAAGNPSGCSGSVTYVEDSNEPSSGLSFPGAGGVYNATAWDAGCATSGACGTASDTGGAGLDKVDVSIKRVSTGLYWDGSGFNSATEDWRVASGTSTWSVGLAASGFPGDGDYTVRARARDNAGNVQSSPASRTFSYENAPPETFVESAPANPSNVTNASFAFSASEPATFECSLDGGTWGSCTSPKSYSGLTQGNHTFEVRATDAAGNTDPTPASYPWTVDTTEPTSTISFPSVSSSYNAGGWNAGCGASGLCGTAADTGGAGLQKVELSIKRESDGSYYEGSGFGAVSETWLTASGTSAWSYAFADSSFPADGDYTVRVRAVDSATNTESTPQARTFTYDTAPPSAALSFPAAGGAYNGAGWNAGCAASGVCGTASDAGTGGLAEIEVSLQRASTGLYWDGSGFNAAAEDWRPASGTAAWSLAFAASSFPADGDYTVRARGRDNAGNLQAAPDSRTFTVDTVAPTSDLSVAEGARGDLQYFDAASDTLYYNPAAAGDFTIIDAPADAGGSGVSKVDFPAISDTGFSGSASSDSGAPYESSAYSFTAANTTAPSDKDVVVEDGAGNQAADTISFSRDATRPSGQSISLNGGPWYGTASIAFTTGDGTDAGAGLDTTSGQVERASAPLVDGVCQAFGAFGGSYVSPDASVASGTCYKYRFSIADRVGNRSLWVETAEAKVDTSAPAVGAAAANAAGAAYWNGSGTLFYRPGGAGSFDLTATVSDGQSGADKATFPNVAGFGAGGDVASPGPYSKSYSFTGTPAEPGSVAVVGHNNAGLTDSASVSITADSSAPSGHSVSITGGWYTTASVALTPTDGSDTGSGVDTSSRVYERDEATLSVGTCGAFADSWTTVSNPDTSVSSGKCYRYRLQLSDRVGNQSASGPSATAKVDLDGPSAPSLTYGSFTNASATGSTVYFRPGAAGGFRVTASSVDNESGVASYAFPTLSGAGWSGSQSGASSDYSFTTTAVDPAEPNNVGATNGAGLDSSATFFTVTPDGMAPDEGSVDYPDGYTSSPITIATDAGNDGGAGIDPSSGVIERQTAPLTGGTCGSYGSWTAVTSPDTIAAGLCVVYRYRVSDRVGNEQVYTSTNVAKTDNGNPTVTLDDLGANLRLTVPLTATADDAMSGVASVEFQRRPAGGGAWTAIDSDATSPYSVSFNTTSVADGVYDFRAVATDNAGNSTASNVVADRRVDNTPPTATMGDPGTYLRAVVTLTSTTDDPGGSGVATVSYERSPAGAGSWTATPATWDTTTASDQLYDLRVVVTDVAGNTTNSAAITNRRVDNTPPDVTMMDPGPFVTGTVSLAATADDGPTGSGIDTVTYEYKLSSDTTWTPTPAAWDTSALPDGSYDLWAIATDRAGNTTTSDPVTVLLDNTAPDVSITSPVDGGYVNAAAPDPETTVADADDNAGSGVARVEFLACSDASVDCSTGTWTSFDTDSDGAPFEGAWPLPADGNRALKAIATDNADHTAEAVINVTVDRTPPDTTITMQPGDPSNVAAPTFEFTSNEEGSTFECSLEGGAFEPCTSPDLLADLPDGPHTFAVQAIDLAGNVDASPATWTWLVDTTPPTATMDDPGPNLRGTVTLTSLTEDPGANASGLATVDYQYSADAGTTWASTPEVWDTTLVTDGLYAVRVVATDNAGNVTESAPIADRRVDNTPPATAIDDPGANLRQTVNLTGSATDEGSGVLEVEFQYTTTGGTVWSTIGAAATAPYQVSFDTLSVLDGLYDFRTVARDVAGNETEGTPVTIRRVDNTPPTATMNDPGANLRGTVTLSSVTDDAGGSGVSNVVYAVSPAGADSWTPISSAWDSRSVADGMYDLHVVVTDVAGNETISVPVGGRRVDNTPPGTSDNAPGGWQRDAVTVTLSASDSGSGVSNTQYSVDGGGYSSGTSVTIPAPSDGSNDGIHTIAYFSTDVAGNIESPKTATVMIDASPPIPGADDPGTYLRGNVTLSASPSDSNGIESVEFQRSDVSGWETIGADNEEPYSAQWNTGDVADGPYDLRVVVTDEAGNESTEDLPGKIVDNTAPSASVGSPPAGSTVSGDVSIGATALDANPITSVEFFVRGGSIGTATSAPFTRSWDSRGGPDGGASIYVVVTDIAGNSTTSSTISITVDNFAPGISLGNPGGNVRGTVSLGASADGDTVQVTFERRPAGGGGWTTITTDTSAPWSADFNTTLVTDGMYELRAIAVDGGSNSSASNVQTTRVDNTPPSGSVTAPGDGSTVGGSAVPLGANAGDSGSGVAQVTWEYRPTGVGGYAAITSASSPPYQGTWNVSSIPSGVYDVRVVVNDVAGNAFSTAPIQVTVDSTAPGVVLGDPGAQVSGTITLTATTTGSANSVTFSYSPAGANSWTTIGVDTSEPWSRTFNTASVPDGLYDFRAVASDSLGNTASSVRSGIRIDNTAPSIVSSVPANNSIVASASSIQLTASEDIAGLTGVTLDGSATVPPIISGKNATFNTGSLSSGGHTLKGTVSDGAGKSSTFTIFFTVGTPPPPPPPPPAPTPQPGTGTTPSPPAPAPNPVGISPPTNFTGTIGPDGTLTLRWKPGRTSEGKPAPTILYVDGVAVMSFPASQTQVNLGPFTAADMRVFALTAQGPDGTTSARTYGLRAVPALFGRTLAEATQLLDERDFTVGAVAGSGTVVKPAGVVLAPERSAVDLVLAQPETKLVFQVVGPKRFSWTKRKYLGARMKSTRSASVVVSLLSPRSERLYRWRLSVKAGTSIVKLWMPRQVRRPGMYRLVFNARAGREAVKRTLKFRLVGRKLPGVVNPGPVDVVLAGSAELREELALGLGDEPNTRVLEGNGDSTFDLAGAAGRNVEVIVVDVDAYGVGLVRDLHIVFPMVRIVALSDDPKKLAQAMKAGATVALPKSTPADKLADVIRRLAHAR